MNHKIFTLFGIGTILGMQLMAMSSDPNARASEALGESGKTSLSPTKWLPLPGIARPSREVAISAPLEGMLAEIRVREGQRVEQGEILAVIDNRVARASVSVAEAAADRTGEIQQAREEVRFSQIHLDRQQQLKVATGGSGFELLEAETRYEKAKAALQSAEQEQRRAQQTLELERARLESHNIRAPFRGEVLQLPVQPGTTLTRDDQLVTLICVDQLVVELYVPLALYGQLKVGQEYPLVAGQPVHRTVTGRLDFVAPVIDSATGAFRAVFAVNNEDLTLPAGFTVQLDSPLPSHLTRLSP
jgi:membrane fusion protein (multidrug efflux system)